MRVHRSRFKDINSQSVRVHNSEEKRAKELLKLSPYLNFKAYSPKKENIGMITRGEKGRQLRKVRVERNKVEGSLHH